MANTTTAERVGSIPGHRRVLAVVLELIPLLSVVPVIGTDNGTMAPRGMFIALASGLGWISLGRWTTSFVIFAVRAVTLLGLLGGAFLIFWVFSSDCTSWDCIDRRIGVDLIATLVVGLLSTLASAAAAGLQSRWATD